MVSAVTRLPGDIDIHADKTHKKIKLNKVRTTQLLPESYVVYLYA